MTTADELLARMQQRVREQSAPTASSAEELGQLRLEAVARDAGVQVGPTRPSLESSFCWDRRRRYPAKRCQDSPVRKHRPT